MKSITSQFNRGDGSIQNFIRMLKPILEEKELIGTRMKVAELAKICRSHHRRLPVRNRQALELVGEIKFLGRGNTFRFDDLDVSVYMEFDPATHRRSPEIEFHLAVSLEQQHLNSLRNKAATQPQEQLI